MTSVLIKACAFILIVILGYTLKRKGFFKPTDFKFLSKIVMNITLPCAVITSFSQLKMDFSLLFLVVIGILCNLLTISIGYLISRKKPPEEKAFHMINLSGYNIGCFTLPYIQAFLGPAAVVGACLFDAGNSMLCTGGTYSIASAAANSGERSTVSSFVKKILSSVPFDTYMIMLILSSLNWKLPAIVTTFASTVGAANGFLAMLMIGVGFEMMLEKQYLKKIFQLIGIRYGCSAVLALIFYFALPFPLEIRQILVIVVFSPVSSIAAVFTQKCKGNVALASAVNSVSIIVGITAITCLLMLMQV